MANENNNFVPVKGKWKMTTLPMKASTVMVEGAAIAIEISSNTTTGYYTLMGTENAAGKDFVGILAEPIAAADGDYATAGKLKSVWIPRDKSNAEAKFSVGAGTFTAIDVGKSVQIGSDSISLDVDTAGLGARITKYLNADGGSDSAGQGYCVFNLPTTETA